VIVQGSIFFFVHLKSNTVLTESLGNALENSRVGDIKNATGKKRAESMEKRVDYRNKFA